MNNKKLWEEAVGGQIGEKFRRALKNDLLLKEFIKEYPFETQNLAKSYQTYFKEPHPQLSKTPQTFRSPLTLGLSVILVLILSSGGIVVYGIIKQKGEIETIQPQTKVPDISKDVEGVSIEELSTLENIDAGYLVKYPANLDAMYTQDGVEFTPKNGKGKVILQVKDAVANVTIKQDQIEQSSILDDAAQIIKNTFQLTQPISSDKASNEGRFKNIYFDPKKY